MFDELGLAGCFVVDRKVWEKNWFRRTKYKTQDKGNTQQQWNFFLIQSKYKYYDIYYGKYAVFLTHNLQIHDLVTKNFPKLLSVSLLRKNWKISFSTHSSHRNQGNSFPSERKYCYYVLLQELRNVTKGNFIFGCFFIHCIIMTNMTLIFENNRIHLNFSF